MELEQQDLLDLELQHKIEVFRLKEPHPNKEYHLSKEYHQKDRLMVLLQLL